VSQSDETVEASNQLAGDWLKRLEGDGLVAQSLQC
jgi:hypothetical protein